LSTALHWFRRDLRVADNQALHAASRTHDRVYGLYLFEERALRSPSQGAPRLAFALDSLRSLEKNLHERGSQLLWRRGEAVAELVRAVRETGAEALYYNFDGEPAGFARDRRVRAALEAQGIVVRAWKDDVLHDAREVLKADGKPYVVFTPYAAAWRALPKEAPVPAFRLKMPVPPLPAAPLPTLAELGFTLEAEICRGGEHVGQGLLKGFLSGPMAAYQSRRDFPAVEGTSRLSPHLALGTLSPRTVYAKAAEAIAALPACQREEGETFQKELIWREFYRQILWKFPHVETEAFRPAYNEIAWENDERHFAAWCAGKTGFPLVDAAMRQLNATGWMHNRLRMIVAMFLTKDLLVSWQWGERYFMQRLVDGDLASNNGGWQWSASTGTDAQPYFRIFNPNRQAERYDPEGAFIARWVPEAERPGLGYRPIVDHAAQRLKALALFKRLPGTESEE
jgi:deoxyribodipyrimidine photo-lyase